MRISATNKLQTMHFIYTYDLSESGDRRAELVRQMEEILPADNFYRCLESVYVIHVEDNAAWNNVLRRLTEWSRNIHVRFRFIMSPLTSNGMYNGMLSGPDWERINQLSY